MPRDTVRFGMWVFLASEVLLFAAMLTLYAAYRMRFPVIFQHGVDLNNRTLGTLNTFVLLTSSYTMACATHALARAQRRVTLLWLAATAALALAFLAFKGVEYTHHAHEGYGVYALNAAPPGLRLFLVLYYVLTGTHGVHVLVGLVLIGAALGRVARNPAATSQHAPWLDLIALYWHFVDIVWILLWPLLYLTGSPP